MKSIFVCFAFLLTVLKVDRKNSSHTWRLEKYGCENSHWSAAHGDEIAGILNQDVPRKHAQSAFFSTRKHWPSSSISADANLKELNFALQCVDGSEIQLTTWNASKPL